MDVYTYQIAKWRLVKALDSGIVVIDTTVKSGYSQVAPSWDMVMGHKAGTVSDEKYTQMYHDILDYSRQVNPNFWGSLLRLEKIALGCYCSPGKFCHRHLLVNYLRQLTTVNYVAEIGQTNNQKG